MGALAAIATRRGIAAGLAIPRKCRFVPQHLGSSGTGGERTL